MRLARPILALGLLAGLLSAGDRQSLIKATVKQLETAYKSCDWQLVRSALWRAKAIRDRYSQKEAKPLAQAIVKGVNHEDPRIAHASAEMLAELRIAGTTKLMAKLLYPPKDVSIGRRRVHLACIKTAAELHDSDGARAFERLLQHSDREFAVAGAASLSRYWVLDTKPLIALVRKLAKALEVLDGQLASAKEEKKQARIKHYQAVRDALVQSLRKLTERDTINTPEDCLKWIHDKKVGSPS